MTTDLDWGVTLAMSALLKRLESFLPKGWGVMTWVYSLDGTDLQVRSFASHESTAETLRILRVTAAQMIKRDAREGRHGPEHRYSGQGSREQPAPPGDLVVSSVTVQQSGSHDRVRVWSRGGLSGELIVSAGDGTRLAELLTLQPDR